MSKPNGIREKLIAAGVRNLREFGYPSCNETNILKDAVFVAFFRSMLKDNLGKGFDSHIAGLLSELPPELDHKKEAK